MEQNETKQQSREWALFGVVKNLQRRGILGIILAALFITITVLYIDARHNLNVERIVRDDENEWNKKIIERMIEDYRKIKRDATN